ncbi:MAG TPA: aldehyde dehydrogenase family protein [Candidatus Acidoferrales bacterium]|nr:aldehyde dehydrogenase family protein [Candidatus Acidoferrales bacterium]
MTSTLSHPETPYPEIDAELAALREGAAVWAAMPVGAKIELLQACRQGVHAVSRRWTKAAAGAKGIAGTPLAGEEAVSGPWAVLLALNRYLDTLQQIDAAGAPAIAPSRVRTRAGGQVVVDVFPVDLYDRVLLNGMRAEVWMQPEVTPQTLAATMGVWYRRSERRPRVALVLGAGNIASIPALDVLYKLIAEGAVCALKMNPVNDYLGPIFEEAFEPLVRGGFLRLAYGGAAAGKYLCAHPAIDEVHVTGSAATHDAIVWGDGPEAAARKLRRDPVLRKPITSELGNVSPTIVLPGAWTHADFRFQAENVLTQKLHNDGFNCIAAQVLILPSEWDGTPKLLAAIEELAAAAADRPAYYPGAAQRLQTVTAGAGDVLRYGRRDGDFLPRTLFFVDAGAASPAFSVEAFSSALAVTTLPGDFETFARDAVAFANDRLRGSLGGNLIVDPHAHRQHEGAVDEAIAAMRYGCVGVNAWTGVGFLRCETPWGAFPGETLEDVRSGIGSVHNAHLFSKPQKSVVYAPFAPFPRSLFGYGGSLLPKPPWFVTNRRQAQIGEALCDFEYAKSPWTLAKVALLAMTA